MEALERLLRHYGYEFDFPPPNFHVKVRHTCKRRKLDAEYLTEKILAFSNEEEGEVGAGLSEEEDLWEDRACDCEDAFLRELRLTPNEQKHFENKGAANPLHYLYRSNNGGKHNTRFVWCCPLAQLVPVRVLVTFGVRDLALVQYDGVNQEFKDDIFMVEWKSILKADFPGDSLLKAASNTVFLAWERFERLASDILKKTLGHGSTEREDFLKSYENLDGEKAAGFLEWIAGRVAETVQAKKGDNERMTPQQRKEKRESLDADLFALLGMYSVLVAELDFGQLQFQSVQPTGKEAAGSIHVLFLHNLLEFRFSNKTTCPAGCCLCSGKGWFTLHSLVCDLCGAEEDVKTCVSASEREFEVQVYCGKCVRAPSSGVVSSGVRRIKPLESVPFCQSHIPDVVSGCSYNRKKCVVCKAKEVRYTFSGEKPVCCGEGCFAEYLVRLPKSWGAFVAKVNLRKERSHDDSSGEEEDRSDTESDQESDDSTYRGSTTADSSDTESGDEEEQEEEHRGEGEGKQEKSDSKAALPVDGVTSEGSERDELILRRALRHLGAEKTIQIALDFKYRKMLNKLLDRVGPEFVLSRVRLKDVPSSDPSSTLRTSRS